MNLEQFFTPYESHSKLPGKKVLVLAPHPDDEVFGCGATLTQMVQAGCDVRVIVLTDGVLASEWSELPAEQAQYKKKAKAELRRSESIAAASCLGYSSPEFMGWGDGELLCDDSAAGVEKNDAYLAVLNHKVEQLQPDLILAPSIWEMHRDHRAVAQWALRLITNKGESNSVINLALYEVGVPLPANFLIDTTTSQNRLNSAMQCFQSQLEGQAYANQVRGLNSFRSYTLGLAVECAEAFYLLSSADVPGFETHNQPGVLSLALQKSERELIDKASVIASLSVDVADGRKRLGELDREVADLRQALSQVQGTFSWRVTAPLRWIRRHFLSKK